MGKATLTAEVDLSAWENSWADIDEIIRTEVQLVVKSWVRAEMETLRVKYTKQIRDQVEASFKKLHPEYNIV